MGSSIIIMRHCCVAQLVIIMPHDVDFNSEYIDLLMCPLLAYFAYLCDTALSLAFLRPCLSPSQGPPLRLRGGRVFPVPEGRPNLPGFEAKRVLIIISRHLKHIEKRGDGLQVTYTALNWDYIAFIPQLFGFVAFA